MFYSIKPTIPLKTDRPLHTLRDRVSLTDDIQTSFVGVGDRVYWRAIELCGKGAIAFPSQMLCKCAL